MGFIHCNLRVLMAEKNMNIKDIFENTSLSRTTISNLYNNYANGVKYETLSQLCTFLDCQPGDLLTFYDVEIEIETDNIVNGLNVESLYHQLKTGEDWSELINRTQLNTIVKLKYNEGKFEFGLPVLLDSKFSSSLVMNINIEFDNSLKSQFKKMSIPFVVENYIFEHLTDLIIKEVHELFDFDIGLDPFQTQFESKISD
ncbi:helix-turn-helix domain-containing protein [Evansella halocellulosilytica]|uniref:helix-turn-helix domain-containing protein n=1 Tax=Evansella halocellulosilytica TaxID=2011013 RepID=UPI000BB8D3CD|nr:helix-turn-helix transcriptional regulator [Evansella halocellulosilytica]